MTASSSSPPSEPRYAPEDPTLPKPWKGLVAGSTGYLYYWNPETNVTQYERPVDSSNSAQHSLPLSRKSSSVPMAISSSVQIHHPSDSPTRGSHSHSVYDDDGRHNLSQYDQNSRGISNHSKKTVDDSLTLERGMSNSHIHGPVSRLLGASDRGHGSTDIGTRSYADAYRRQYEITVTGVDVPQPFTTFESTGFPSEILREVHHAGFLNPTPIQAQSWPIILQNRDIVAIAKTGSGKTLGYLIPCFLHLKHCHNNPQLGPTVLVLSPTRELATQIQAEALKFGRSSRISCTCLYGGAPKGPQLKDLERGTGIVVATPGRLNDFLEMKSLSLHQVSYLVLDEADRMLDMGFEPQIRKIVEEIPSSRQTLMFTATWPKEVRKIASELLVNPVQVNVGSIDELVANKAITQFVELVTPMEKQRRLEQILHSQEPRSKVIVFCTTKKMCDQLVRILTRQFSAVAIHGDKSQGERDYVLNQFRTGRSSILVATDVATRGLDIKDIRVVINYDFPTGIEDYVHRIGRTGRAGATGVSYTFFSEQDAKYASELVKVLEGTGQRVPPEICEMASRVNKMHKIRIHQGPGASGHDRERPYVSIHGMKESKLPALMERSGRGNEPWRKNCHEVQDSYGRVDDGISVEGRGRRDQGFTQSHDICASSRDKDRVYKRSPSPSFSRRRVHDHDRNPVADKGHGDRLQGSNISHSSFSNRSHGPGHGHRWRRSRSPLQSIAHRLSHRRNLSPSPTPNKSHGHGQYTSHNPASGKSHLTNTRNISSSFAPNKDNGRYQDQIGSHSQSLSKSKGRSQSPAIKKLIDQGFVHNRNCTHNRSLERQEVRRGVETYHSKSPHSHQSLDHGDKNLSNFPDCHSQRLSTCQISESRHNIALENGMESIYPPSHKHSSSPNQQTLKPSNPDNYSMLIHAHQ